MLKDSEAEEASSVTLLCETAQIPSTVTWLKGHTELKNGGRYEISQRDKVMILTIKQLEEKDTDMYTCDVGTAKSMAKVTINGKNIWIYSVNVCAYAVSHMLNVILYHPLHQSSPIKDSQHSIDRSI